MRCPSCGTENAPDSRFCGGCGYRLTIAPPEARVAPTAKLADDTPYTSQAYAPPQPSRPPVSVAPQSIPPQSIPPQSRVPTPPPGSLVQPHGSGATASRASTAPPQRSISRSIAASSPSLSMPVPRRNTGLVVVVLIVDLALAGTGGLLLAKGLAKPAAKPEVKTQADPPPAPPPSPQKPEPITPPTPVAATPPTAPEAAATGGAPALPPPPEPDKKHPNKKPYDPNKGLVAEIELAAAHSKTTFDACYATAATGATVHGSIKIAFQVTTDGHVAHAASVENTTGKDQLAACLASTIGSWTFAAHPAATADFVRPFNYP